MARRLVGRILAGVALAAAALARGAAAQEGSLQAPELVGTWVGDDSTPGGTRRLVLRLDPDGGYRAVEVETAATPARRGVVTAGRWAAVRTADGTMLCLRADGAKLSRCRPSRPEASGAGFTWEERRFLPGRPETLEPLGGGL